MKKLTFLLLAFVLTNCYSQVTHLDWLKPSSAIPPASVFDNITGWWRADTYSGSVPSGVTLIDKSLNSHNMVQIAGTMTPGTAANGQPKFTASGGTLQSTLTLRSWPITVFTVGKRTSGATTGMFGHPGGGGPNTLWCGYESVAPVNSFYIYNTESQINPTTEYGADAVYAIRIGDGSRISIVNGMILSSMSLCSQAKSAALATQIGTDYRSLNMDWYETLVWDRLLSLAEIDEVHAYLNTRYGMSIPLWSSYTVAKTLGYGGQSNANGRGDRGAGDVNVPVQYRTEVPGVYYGVDIGPMDLSADISYANTGGQDGAGYINPVLASAKDYHDIIGEDLHIFSVSQGGTSMSDIGAVNGFWRPDHGNIQNYSFSDYADTMTNWWIYLRACQQAELRPEMVGYMFFQGEQDATDEPASNNWSSVAQIFFNTLRIECGVGNFKVLLVRIHVGNPEPYTDNVRAQQDLCAAALTNCVLIDTDSFGTRAGDPVHLSAAGQISLGQFLATQY